jgi:hypothetical protein
VVDTREVEYPAQEAHGMHPLGSHAFRPRVSNETPEQQKIALSRVKVGILDSSGGTIED